MIINTDPIKDLGFMMIIGTCFIGATLCTTNVFMNGEIDQVLRLVLLVGAVISLILGIITTIKFNKSSKEKNKIIKGLLKYKKFMVATNQYTITAIAEEFDETEEDVEKFIQKAIDEHILLNVYLSKKTKELLLIHKKNTSNKAKINQQNVSVENNVIINEKSE